MQDTPLGKSNMRVSRLALGSMMAMTMAGTAASSYAHGPAWPASSAEWRLPSANRRLRSSLSSATHWNKRTPSRSRVMVTL